MGLQAPKARDPEFRETPSDCDDGPLLDETAVLGTLELSEPFDDDSDPARGVAYGIVIGTVLWTMAIVAYSIAS